MEDAPPITCLPVLGEDRVVVEGQANLLAAYPKAGKTTLLAQCVRDWMRLGHHVVYFSEESRSTWRTRVQRSGGDWSRLRVVFVSSIPDDTTALVVAQSSPEDVVIVDTLRAFANMEDESDAARVRLAIRPWVEVSHRHGKTVVIAMHTRKSGGEHGQAIAGSHEFFAAVDQAIELDRFSADTHSRRRRLTTHGREFETTVVAYTLSDDDDLVSLGSAESIMARETGLAILAHVQGSEWQTARQIATAVGRSAATRLALRRLVRRGLVERDPQGNAAPGQTVRYRRAPRTGTRPVPSRP